MTSQFARVAFVNEASGARLEGEFIADTGPTWMVKPQGKPVQVLQKSEWISAPTQSSGLDDRLGGIFDMFGARS